MYILFCYPRNRSFLYIFKIAFNINEESYILEFIEELKFLNIRYILSDVTSDFLNEKLDLNPDQFKQLKNLFY